MLDRVRGKKTEGTLANGAVTEQEAYQIVVVERHAQAGELQSPYGDTATVATGPGAPEAPSQTARSQSVAERVAVRFLNANLCQLNRASRLNSMVQCYGMAEAAAAEAYGNWTRRAAAVLRTLHRAAADVRDLPGRKAILLMSADLMRDRALDRQFRDVIAAAQRANTAVYFGGARGLVGVRVRRGREPDVAASGRRGRHERRAGRAGGRRGRAPGGGDGRRRGRRRTTSRPGSSAWRRTRPRTTCSATSPSTRPTGSGTTSR